MRTSNDNDFLATGTLAGPLRSSSPRPSRDFARTVVAPVSAKHDEEHSFPYEVVARMGEMGLFGLPFPEEYGGMGGDYFALCLALEELGKVDQSVAITLEAGVAPRRDADLPVRHRGAEAGVAAAAGQRQALAALRADRAGGGIRCRRHPHHRAPGRRRLGHQRHQAVHHQLRHRHHPAGHRHRGHRDAADGKKEISTIIVPSGTDGFTVEPAYNKVGWNASDTHPLTFDDARVPEENLLGERGRGYANFLRILDEGRIAIAALATGAAQGCVDESVKYAKEREAFGAADRHATRPSRSRSRGWRRAPTPPAPPTTTPPR